MDLQKIDNASAEIIDDVDRIVETLISVSDKPIDVSILLDAIKEALASNGHVNRAGLEALLQNSIMKLNAAYQSSGNSFRIEKLAGGYRMMTLPECEYVIRKYLHPLRHQRLSRAAMETLAVIAYRQPATKSEVERIRGVSVDGVMRTLLDRKLVRISGRADSPGRPLIYSTDGLFLEYFGLNDISELPDGREIESLLGKPEPESPPKLLLKHSGEPVEPTDSPAVDDHSNDATGADSDEVGIENTETTIVEHETETITVSGENEAGADSRQVESIDQ